MRNSPRIFNLNLLFNFFFVALNVLLLILRLNLYTCRFLYLLIYSAAVVVYLFANKLFFVLKAQFLRSNLLCHSCQRLKLGICQKWSPSIVRVEVILILLSFLSVLYKTERYQITVLLNYSIPSKRRQTYISQIISNLRSSKVTNQVGC